MAVSIIGPKFYAWDSNTGKPLAFGKVYTYQAGTNTPKATFTTEGGETQNANPVILNGAGYADIYLNGSYKIVVKDANDVEVWTSDPVSDPSQLQQEWVRQRNITQVNTTTFTVDGGLTDEYVKGVAIRVKQDSGFVTGTVVSATYANGKTTVELSMIGGATISSTAQYAERNIVAAFSSLGSDLIAHTGTSDTVTQALDKRTIYVGSVAELAARSPSAGDTAVLSDELRYGVFVFKSGDQSVNVTNDPEQGIWIAPSSDATGASGAWVRRYNSSDGVNAFWFGAKGDNLNDDYVPIQAAIDYVAYAYPITVITADLEKGGGIVSLPEPDIGYYFSQDIVIKDNIALVGASSESVTLTFPYQQDFVGIKNYDGDTALAPFYKDFLVKNLTLRHAGVNLVQPNRSTLVNLRAIGVISSTASPRAAFRVQLTTDLLIERCYAFGCDAGFLVDNAGVGPSTSLTFYKCRAQQCNKAPGFEFRFNTNAIHSSSMIDCISEYNKKGILLTGRGTGLVVENVHLENNTDYDIEVYNGASIELNRSGGGRFIAFNSGDTKRSNIIINNCPGIDFIAQYGFAGEVIIRGDKNKNPSALPTTLAKVSGDGYRSISYGSAIPTVRATYESSDLVIKTPSSGVDGNVGWVALSKGTVGSLGAVTLSGISGDSSVTISPGHSLMLGEYIEIAGAPGVYKVTYVDPPWLDGTTIGISPALSTTVSGAAVTFKNPTWREFGADVYMVTTADLESLSSAINTEYKSPGKQVFNSTNGRPVWAQGGGASATWNYADGTTAHTPI